jgi:hypothetical protein
VSILKAYDKAEFEKGKIDFKHAYMSLKINTFTNEIRLQSQNKKRKHNL